MADASHARVIEAIKAKAPALPANETLPERPNLRGICAAQPGRHKRLPTYLAPLDEALSGGLQTGRLAVAGGPPGVAKTSLFLALTYNMASQGARVGGRHHPVHVGYCASDEPRDGCLSRLAQIEGLFRSDLEDEDTSISGPAWLTACERIAAVETFTLWDPREDHVNVEAITRTTARDAAASGGRAIVVVDSLQTAPFYAELGLEAQSLRERTDAKIKALRALSIKLDVCFIVLSELNRSGYGQGRTADLSSFKESSGIEYGVDVGLVLARVPDQDALTIDVTIVKSRLGDSGGTFRLERTPRCTFRAIASPDKEEIEESRLRAKEAKEATDVQRIQNEIVKLILGTKAPPTTRRELLALVAGKNELKSQAITCLQADGRLIGGNGKPFAIGNGGAS